MRHGISLLILLTLDAQQSLRRLISRAFLRVAAVILSSVLVALIFFSLLALTQITHSVQSLIGDSMVGLEASVGMRAAVRETQLDLLRLRLAPGRKLPSAEIDAFYKRMNLLIESYRSGVFEAEDQLNTEAIESGLKDYLAVLSPLRDNAQPETSAILAADGSARQLVNVVEKAYQFNRARIHASADEADGSARQALRIANRLGWSFAIFIISLAVVYFAYRWLALPEEGDA